MSYPGPSAQAIATIHTLEAELAASRARVVEQVVEIRRLRGGTEPTDAKKVTAIGWLRGMAQRLLDERNASAVTARGDLDFTSEAAMLLDVAAWIDNTRHPEMRGAGLEREFSL